MTGKILSKKSVLNLIISVTSLLIATNSALAAEGGGGGHAEAASAIHTDVANTTTGATMAANAGTAGTTMPGSAAALEIPTLSYDPTRPYYVGATLGWADIYYQKIFYGPAYNSSPSGFAGRIYAGYRFTDTISVEGGYSRFSDVRGSYTTVDPVFGLIRAEGTIRTYIFDAVIKINTALKNKFFNRFNIYGKLGMAYLNEAGGTLNNDALLLPSIPGSPVQVINNTNPVGNKLLPTFSIGLNYHIVKNLEADLTWMHVQMMGSSALNNTDFVGLGLAYSL